MNQLWLPEAALRSLLMGATIFAVLKVLRIRQVHAQRTAWVLALLAAVAMPALVRWPVGPSLLPTAIPSALRSSIQSAIHSAIQSRASSLPAPAAAPVLRQVSSDRMGVRPGIRETEAHANASVPTHHTLLVDRAATTPQLTVVQPVRYSRTAAVSAMLARALPYAAVAYALIAFLLLARLAVGLALALRLRRNAATVAWHDWSAMKVGDNIRITSQVQTPVTIASSIILPEASETWEAAKLRMVLAHERAHVQQADFYIHLLAGLNCAIFWFSPFSWWLQRRLSALGEALSDLAALQQADSRSSYAEVLLEFARSMQGTQPPSAAVAMARRSNLRSRIERLLNDRLFTEAFSAKRLHLFVAASIVPVALLASASLVRVRAAVQAPAVAATPPAPAASPKPAATIQAGADQAAASADAAMREKNADDASADDASDDTTARDYAAEQAASWEADRAIADNARLHTGSASEEASQQAEQDKATAELLSRYPAKSQVEQDSQRTALLRRYSVASKEQRDKEMAELLGHYRPDAKDVAAWNRLVVEMSSQHAQLANEAALAHSAELAQLRAGLAMDRMYGAQAVAARGAGANWKSSRYTYRDNDRDSFALVIGNEVVSFDGNFDDRFNDIRRNVQGDFIYCKQKGKFYVIEDPALLAKAKALYAPMDVLSKQQEELGRQQEALGAQQEALGKQQEAVKVPTPDLSKELASLDEAMQKLKALQGNKEVTQQSLAEVQERIGEIQGRLGNLQGLAGEQMGKLGEEQDRLGEQQRKLGEEQGRLGEQQGKIGEEAQRKLKPLIDQAIRDGRAKPVD